MGVVGFGVKFVHAIYIALAIDYRLLEGVKETIYYDVTLRLQFLVCLYLSFRIVIEIIVTVISVCMVSLIVLCFIPCCMFSCPELVPL